MITRSNRSGPRSVSTSTVAAVRSAGPPTTLCTPVPSRIRSANGATSRSTYSRDPPLIVRHCVRPGRPSKPWLCMNRAYERIGNRVNVDGSADQIALPNGTRNCSTNDREYRPRRRNDSIDSSPTPSVASSPAAPGRRSAPCPRASSATSRRAARLNRTMSPSRRRKEGRRRFRRCANNVLRLEPRYSSPLAPSVTLKLISVGCVSTPNSRNRAVKPG